MKTRIFFCSAVSLISLLCLSGCVANSFGLSEEDQEKAIKKYPRTGLNLQPDDGFFMITGKVFARTLLCPLTLAQSEGILLAERNKTFSSYALDLQNQKLMEETKTYFDRFLDQSEEVVLSRIGNPKNRINLKNGETVLLFSNSNVANESLNINVPYFNFKVNMKKKIVQYSNDLQGNFKKTAPMHNTAFDRLYFDSNGKCSGYEVLKQESTSIMSVNGKVTFF